MSNTITSASALYAYANSMLAKTGRGVDAENSQATGGAGAVDKAIQSALATPVLDFKTGTAQHKLEDQQASLAAQLRTSMAKAGATLEGNVEFSVGSNGQLAITGSDADKASLDAFMKADKSQPGFTSRLTSLAKDAEALSDTSRQTTAISVAARYAGSSKGLLSLYQSLMKQQDTSPAVFSFSSTSSSLRYPGVLSSQA